MSELISEIKELIKYRELLSQMVIREIKGRYKQSILGYFWVILNPLAQMIVMSFAFSIILRVPTNSTSGTPYSIFLFVALLPWNLFANSLSSASVALVSSASLITKIYFPRSILVISTIIAKIIDFLFALTVLIGYMIFYHTPITLNILWVIPIFFIQQIFTLALGLFFAAGNLIYRDIQYLLTLILTLWMYVTPVIYPIDIVPKNLRFIFQINPMSDIINAYRDSILSGGSPKISSLLITFVVSVVILILCLKYFKAKERNFADNI